MCSVASQIPAEAFHFSGQSSMDAWTLKDLIDEMGSSRYDRWRSREIHLTFQRIRELADDFPTWQHRAETGRPATEERTLIIASMLRQFLRATFDSLEGYLHVFADFFRIQAVPDSKTMSAKNRSPRFAHLLRRFHEYVLLTLPARKGIVATDATGYSNLKDAWRTTPYPLRATQGWIKSHCAVQVPQLLYLSSVKTKGGKHESQKFEDVWAGFPENFQPERSLADGAYSGEHCLTIAKEHGATPLHGIRKDAKHTALPETNYQKLVNFAKHWPNRFAELTGLRSLVETTFDMTKGKFGHQLRCRHPIARDNEIQAKETAHNIRVITMRDYLVASG